MQVKSLEISKRPNYDSEFPNEIVGTVEIVGASGDMKVRLFPSTIMKIFHLCKEDVQKVANYNASQAATACELAADTIALQLSNNEMKQIERSI